VQELRRLQHVAERLHEVDEPHAARLVDYLPHVGALQIHDHHADVLFVAVDAVLGAVVIVAGAPGRAVWRARALRSVVLGGSTAAARPALPLVGVGSGHHLAGFRAEIPYDGLSNGYQRTNERTNERVSNSYTHALDCFLGPRVDVGRALSIALT
jgi:hypothetical protein